MTKHPTKDWGFDDTIEESFVEWFNDLNGGYALRSEYFFGDCEVEDVKTRKDIMYKWLHSSFYEGFMQGRCGKSEERVEGDT